MYFFVSRGFVYFFFAFCKQNLIEIGADFRPESARNILQIAFLNIVYK